MEQENREGGVEKQRRRTSSGWSLLLLLLTSCLVLMKWLVILGEERKHMTIECHLPLLVCTCVGSGYCVPLAGGRRQDAHGIGVRWSIAGLCFRKANSSLCRAGHCREIGWGRKRWGQEDLHWCMWWAAGVLFPTRDRQLTTMSWDWFAKIQWLFGTSVTAEKERRKFNFQQESCYNYIVI